MSEKTSYTPGPAVDKRYGISSRTRARWRANPDLNFPKPIVINGREFYKDVELDEFDRSCARSAVGKRAA